MVVPLEVKILLGVGGFDVDGDFGAVLVNMDTHVQEREFVILFRLKREFDVGFRLLRCWVKSYTWFFHECAIYKIETDYWWVKCRG